MRSVKEIIDDHILNLYKVFDSSKDVGGVLNILIWELAENGYLEEEENQPC